MIQWLGRRSASQLEQVLQLAQNRSLIEHLEFHLDRNADMCYIEFAFKPGTKSTIKRQLADYITNHYNIRTCHFLKEDTTIHISYEYWTRNINT